MSGGNNDSPKDINIKGVFGESSSVKIDEGDRLKFGKNILIGLFIISLLVISVYMAYPDDKATGEVFEFLKIGVLPLVTLVISFYFPSKSG